ncbi:MAG: hypothetical protein HYT48_01995 [Candidatus Vogelbacteria bacterium]|nr:hypothetical protein [Candidatus Vogelbacteria bacterium]
MLTTFSIMTVLALGAIVLPVARQWWIIRRDVDGTAASEPDFATVLQRRLDKFYVDFANFFSHLGHYLYFYSLVIVRHLLIWSRFLLHKVEKKFSRLIDSVRGKGVLNHKGSVSIFLAQIKGDK